MIVSFLEDSAFYILILLVDVYLMIIVCKALYQTLGREINGKRHHNDYSRGLALKKAYCPEEEALHLYVDTLEGQERF